MLIARTKNALKGPYWVGEEEHAGSLPKGYIPHAISEPLTFVCIMDLMNRTKQGTSKSGTPLYMAWPLDPQWPPMIVGSREADLSTNRFAVVLWKGYESAYRWPRGEFRSWIGRVGDSEAEQKALLARSGSTANPPLVTLSVMDPTPLFSWDTCNIDPPGCKDIDDVISWKIKNGRVVEVVISIADVSAWVHPGSPEDVEAYKRGQSLYSNGSAISPMIHPILSEQAASLKADGHPRPVLSLRLPSKTWRRQFLVNRRSYTYEEAVGNSVLKEVFAFCGAKTDDPHEWVERAMVLYNVEVAKALHIDGCGILRSQAPPDIEKANRWKKASEASGEPALALLGYSAGLYASSGAHWALGEEAYCHASSPLRRYADIINQRCLVAILKDESPPDCSKAMMDHLNERGRIAKLLDRSLLAVPLDTLVKGEGIVIDLGDLKVGVYFLPWRTRIKVRLLEPFSGALGDRCTVQGFCDPTVTELKRRMVWKILSP